MEKSQTRLAYKNLDGYLQQTNRLKAMSHFRHCLTNKPFCLGKRICIIVENENVKEKLFKELKSNIARTNRPKLVIEVSILKAKQILLEVLRQAKTTKKDEIIPFTTTYNPDNSNVFLIIKQALFPIIKLALFPIIKQTFVISSILKQ